MPGTRTAPAVDGASFSFKTVQIRVIDWTGDKRSDVYKFDVAATPLQIDTFVDAMQAISNASVYSVTTGDVYASVEDSGNAAEEVWEEVGNNLVIQSKNVAGESIRTFVPSINNLVMLENTESIDPTNALLIAYLAAMAALLPAGYSIVGARYTARREQNQQIKI